MGDPKKPRKMYSRPLKLWNKERYDKEKPLFQEFGLKNKQELWKTDSLLRKYTGQAKRLIALRTKQSDVESQQLLAKLRSLGVIDATASLDDVLGLKQSDFLSRRLQTIVHKKSFANSVKQARQFITHRHIKVGDKIITSPSFLVPAGMESSVIFVEGSQLSNPEHPERQARKKKEEKATPTEEDTLKVVEKEATDADAAEAETAEGKKPAETVAEESGAGKAEKKPTAEKSKEKATADKKEKPAQAEEAKEAKE